MRRKVLIAGVEYTKSAFEKRWGEVTSGTECNYFVKNCDEDFINAALDLIPRWKSIKARGAVKYKIRNKKFQGRAVRGIVMISPKSKKELWLGKAKITSELFPRTTEVPEYVQNKRSALVALRQIAEPQIKTFRASVLRTLDKRSLKCPMSGDFIASGEFHIDHRYPFKNLVEEWCRQEGIDLENVEVYCRGVKCYFKSTDLAESWFDYHLMHAQLQALSAKSNLQKGSKFFG